MFARLPWKKIICGITLMLLATKVDAVFKCIEMYIGWNASEMDRSTAALKSLSRQLWYSNKSTNLIAIAVLLILKNYPATAGALFISLIHHHLKDLVHHKLLLSGYSPSKNLPATLLPLWAPASFPEWFPKCPLFASPCPLHHLHDLSHDTWEM